MSDELRSYDRRQDVGQKMFIAILTAIITTIFLGVLGMSIRNYEKSNTMEIRLVKVELIVQNQNELNKKLTDFLESGERWMLQQKYKQGGV